MRTFVYVFLLSFVSTVWSLLWWHDILTWRYVLAACCMAAIASAIGALTTHGRSIFMTSCAALLAFALACASVLRTTHRPTAFTVDSHARERYATLEGVIDAEPDRRPMKTKYVVSVRTVKTASGTVIHPVRGRVLATDHGQWPEYEYGDVVRVSGILERPGQIETFAYDKYLSRYDIYAVMYRARFQKITSGDVSSMRLLFALKQRFEAQIAKLYGEPHASFMAGLLTGSRRGIPEHLMERFNVTGLTHIIAISGYNITIVISVIGGTLFFLPFRLRLIPSIMAVIAFTLFVGASAAVVRAAIMGCLGLMALHASHKTEVRLSILWTLCIMLAWNPKYLWYDAGFQLSFLAVLGLVELGPLLDRFFARVPTVLAMRESLQMTVAAQLSAVPLIVLLFGRLSLIAPIANVLTAPFIPAAMLLGFAGTVISMIWFPAGQLIAFAGWACLEWIILCAETLSMLPMASVDTPLLDAKMIVAYYVTMAAWILFDERRQVQT